MSSDSKNIKHYSTIIRQQRRITFPEKLKLHEGDHVEMTIKVVKCDHIENG